MVIGNIIFKNIWKLEVLFINVVFVYVGFMFLKYLCIIKNVNLNELEYNIKILIIELYKFKFCINLNCVGSVFIIGIISVKSVILYNKLCFLNL